MVAALKRGMVMLAALMFPMLGAHAQDTDHLRLRLVPADDSVAADGDVVIGLEQIPAAGWHTYWVNPGDTGLAPEITWDLPDGVSVDPVVWPAPQAIAYPGGVSYGYDHPSILLMRLHNRSALKPGQKLNLKAHVYDLVCADMCEPVDADLTLSLDIGAGPNPSPEGGRLAQAFDAAPRALDVKAEIAHEKDATTVRLQAPQNDPAARADFTSPEGAYLFFETEDMVAPKALQALKRYDDGFALTVKNGESDWPQTARAVLRFANGHAYRLALGDGAAAMSAADTTQGAAAPTVWMAMGLAFVGGLILNLMPCVFPILSMKLLALSRAGHDQAMARREALVYGAGVLLSFLALALLLEAARSLGAAVGWGFQLQSPAVTAALSILILLVALNMSGVFEVGAGLQSLAGKAGVSVGWATHPYMNALFTGVLAVVVAAPCSAPFMATAVGVALSQNGATAFAIFTALGLGFAAPFVALAYILSVTPQLIRLLPKPGVWMLRLRQVLALPMYAAAVWMVWVFSRQVSSLGLLLLSTALAFLAIGVARPRIFQPARATALLAAPVLALASVVQSPEAAARPQSAAAASSRPFSSEALARLRAQDQPVLLDMTAAWCVTCKVNERLVLSNPKVMDALKRTHTVYMVGDWTRQDEAITQFLSEFGRSGVPFYAYYAPGGRSAQVLPQLLAADQVVDTLESGAGGK